MHFARPAAPRIDGGLSRQGCYRVVSGMLNSCGVQLDDGVPGWPTPPAKGEV